MTPSDSNHPAFQEAWPELPFESWKDTYETLHRYTQIVGKVKLALMPMMNHWWQVALSVSSRGLTTGPMPYGHRLDTLEIAFDFLDHELHFSNSRGDRHVMALEPRPVAVFYPDFLAMLRTLGLDLRIWPVPVEIPDDLTPFDQDLHHASYDSEAVQRWFQTLVRADVVLKEFRARFSGKCSPVHFFWGSFDLACTRFSGRRAPPRANMDLVTQEAYCEEVSSAGYWPGNAATGGPMFYSYAVPEPEGFPIAIDGLEGARYDPQLNEYLLSYDAVRRAPSPRARLLEFFESTYDAAASLGLWDRDVLERPLPHLQAPASAEAGSLAFEQPPAG